MTENQDTPKIQVDQDWKAQAQAEKERLAQQQEAAAEGAADAGPGAGEGAAGRERGLPPADFKTLISTMATQAMLAMGAIPDPATGQRVAHLDLARHHIDMLGVIDDKTKGNLSEEEQQMLGSVVYELRMQYVQLSQSALQQATAAGGPGGGAPMPNA